MTDADILTATTEIFRDLFADDGIVLTPETTADDVDGWDSIKHISLIVAIEDRFGIRIGTGEIEKLSNVGDLLATIRRKLG
jgi:acyl carrier protein